jgi:hypothetical protein
MKGKVMSQLCVRRSTAPAETVDGQTFGPWVVDKVFRDGEFYAMRTKDEGSIQPPDANGPFAYQVVLGGKTYFVLGEKVMEERPPEETFPVVPAGSEIYLQVHATLKEIDWDNLPVCPD